jgi:hypothetical protein
MNIETSVKETFENTTHYYKRQFKLVLDISEIELLYKITQTAEANLSIVPLSESYRFSCGLKWLIEKELNIKKGF